MSDALLFAFGSGVTFLSLAGTYIWLRAGFGDEVDVGKNPRDMANQPAAKSA